MGKSSVDKGRSRYGEKFSLRFHKPIKTYHLTCVDFHPHLLAKFTEVDGDLAVHCWETLENLYQENQALEKENEKLKLENNMLKNTISRNEAYIKRLNHQSDWSN